MANFTKGVWRPKRYHLVLDNGCDYVLADFVKHGTVSDIELCAAAGTAATQAEKTGYDGLRSVERLPELIAALEEIEGIDPRDASTECEFVARNALDQARKEDE